MCSNVGKFNRKCVEIFLLICVCVLCYLPSVEALPLSELYPFGTEASDQQTENSDDGGSDKIHLKSPFKFFGRNKSTLFVNNNGIITFHQNLQDYKPKKFPLSENTSLIAPFWADVDIQRTGGNIWFRKDYSTNLLDRASKEIQSYFITQRQFEASWIFVATWHNVGFYGASGVYGKSRRNTFQAVLVSNEKRSFVIFNYNVIQWTTGSNSVGNKTTGLGGNPAQAGFNAGDRKNYYSIEGAQTDAVINLTRTSNVGLPGKWVFQVDGASVQDIHCSHADQIDLYPEAGPMFGGEEIRVSGPCFSRDFKVFARIRETNDTFMCTVVNDITVTCVMPTVFRTGEVTIEVNPYEMGWNYSSVYRIENVAFLTPKVKRHKPESWAINSIVTVSWNSSENPSNYIFLDLLAFKLLEKDTPSLVIVRSQPVHISADGDVVNASFILNGIIDGNMTSFVVRIRSNVSNELSSRYLWSDVFPVRWPSEATAREMCQMWMDEEKLLSNLTDDHPVCPCTLRQAARDTGRYFVDPLCNLQNLNVDTNCLYNNGASQCFRRNLQISSTNGEMCCYDSAGELMDARDSPYGGGTRSRYHINAQGVQVVPYFSYFERDLAPFLQCCQYSSSYPLCQRYFQYRPPTTCQKYVPPTPAQAAGDPHLTTLDGLEYTFNGIGDFVLMQDENSSVVVQVRAIQAKDTKGNLQNASIFSAVAMKSNASDTIEIYQAEGGSVNVIVNENKVELDETTSSFKGVDIHKSHSEDSTINILIVFDASSVSVSIDVSQDLMNVLVMIGNDNLKGRLQGLLGNYNGDKDDDLISRNKTLVPSTASSRDIHYQFGMTWKVLSTEFLFSNQDNNINVMNYEPVFSLGNSNDPVVLQLCGDNRQCQFDYQVTGNERIAQQTAKFIEKFKEIEDDIKKVIRCPFLDTPENGNKSVSGYAERDNATFWCSLGHQLLYPDSSLRICQGDGTWSGSIAVCVVAIGPPQGDSTIIIYASAGAGSLVIFIIIAIIILAARRLCGKKKKPEEHQLEENPTEIFPPEQHIPTPATVFENQLFLDRLTNLGSGSGFRIPRPTYVDPNLFDEYFF